MAQAHRLQAPVNERTINAEGLQITQQLYDDVVEAGTVFLYLSTLATEPEQKLRWRQSAERWRYRTKRIKAAFNTSARPLEQGEVGTNTLTP